MLVIQNKGAAITIVTFLGRTELDAGLRVELVTADDAYGPDPVLRAAASASHRKTGSSP